MITFKSLIEPSYFQNLKSSGRAGRGRAPPPHPTDLFINAKRKHHYQTDSSILSDPRTSPYSTIKPRVTIHARQQAWRTASRTVFWLHQ